MTENTEKNAGSNLTAIAEYTETAAAVAELRQRHQGVVYDVTNPKEMKKAKEARAEVKGYRVALEKMRVEIKAPALERCRLIDSEAKRITAELLALEEPLDVQIKAEEARKQAEELERLEAERLRVVGIAKAIEDIRNVPGGLIGKPAVIIEGQLAKLRDQVLDPDFFAERFREAEDALAATISRVEQQLRDQREHEAEQKRIAADRAELERIRAENERLQREADERAAAERAEADRKAQEERDRLAAEQREREEAERAERQRQEEEARAAREAQERAEREEAETAFAAERARQAAEQKRLDDERAELERQRKAAEAKAERDRLASLTLRTAAQAVVDHFAAEIANGRAPKVVVDLAAALDNEAKASTVSRGKKAAA